MVEADFVGDANGGRSMRVRNANKYLGKAIDSSLRSPVEDTPIPFKVVVGGRPAEGEASAPPWPAL